MPELKLNRKIVETLDVNIDDVIYHIPLGSSMKRKELEKLKDQKKAIELFEGVFGKELWEDFTVSEQSQIMNAWAKATKEACGMEPGEL